MISSTRSFRFCAEVPLGRRREAENSMFSFTVSIPITISSWKRQEKRLDTKFETPQKIDQQVSGHIVSPRILSLCKRALPDLAHIAFPSNIHPFRHVHLDILLNFIQTIML